MISILESDIYKPNEQIRYEKNEADKRNAALATLGIGALGLGGLGLAGYAAHKAAQDRMNDYLMQVHQQHVQNYLNHMNSF